MTADAADKNRHSSQAHASLPSGLEPWDERLVGRTLNDGKYHIEALLGAGAMGVVYRARHTELEIPVAIKVLNPALLSLPNIRERFRREAQGASRLNHRNSVQVYDFGVDGELLYIAMEYISGGSLFDLMRRGPLSLDRIVDLMSQTCAALAAAHDQGIVHRDVKPENVMLARGTDDDGNDAEVVKVCDFGIAKIPTADLGDSGRMGQASLTQVGEIYGTPNYMSPEQARGERLDGRSDLYSCGVMLYELAVGRAPFEAETPMGLLMQHINSPVPLPRERAPQVLPELEGIILKCLAKRPEERFESARELRSALLALSPNTLGMATPEPLRAAPSSDLLALGTSDTLAALPSGALRAATATQRSSRGWLVALLLLPLVAVAVVWLLLTREPPTSESVAHEAARPEPEPVASPRVPEPPELAQAQVALPVARSPLVLGAFAPMQRAAVLAVAGWPLASPSKASESSLEVGQPQAEPNGREKRRGSERSSKDDASPQSSKDVTPPEQDARVASQAEPATAQGGTDPVPASDTPSDPVEAPIVTVVVEKLPEPEPKAPSEQPKEPAPVPFVGEAAAEIQSLQTGGALPKSLVSRELDARLEDLEKCYQSAAKKAKRDPTQSLSVAFIVDVDGRAGDISVKGATLSGLDGCVSAAFSDLRTRRRPDTGTVDVSFSLRFSPKQP
ncbi:MAG: protein kinase [Myxococcota bacterium]|jgi:serine/threonine-protein kinase|nr:protein kinase [Myxococcota bacterium]